MFAETKEALLLISRSRMKPCDAAQIVGRIAQNTPLSAIRRHSLRFGWHQRAKETGIELADYFRLWMYVRVRLGENTGI